MRKKLLQKMALLAMASAMTTGAWAVDRNSPMNGPTKTIETQTSYYMFNLNTSMYIGTDYDHSAQAAVVKNALQQVQFLNSEIWGYFNLKHVGGFSKSLNAYLFQHHDNFWTDNKNLSDTNANERKSFDWWYEEDSNGVAYLRNVAEIEIDDKYLGVNRSETDRRPYARFAKTDAQAAWAFIPVDISAEEFELFHAREVILFEKINEVEAVDGFNADLIAAATTVYKKADATIAEITAAIASLAAAQYSLADASSANPIDVTAFIVNPGINQSSGGGDNVRRQPFGWENSRHFSGSNNRFTLGGGDTCLEAYPNEGTDDGIKLMQFDYNQTIYGLPNGYYELTVDCRNTRNNGDPDEPNGAAGPYATSGANEYFTGVTTKDVSKYAVKGILVENNTLKIGVKTNGEMNCYWFTADNFTLTYLGESEVKDLVVDATSFTFFESGEKKFKVSGDGLTSDVTISGTIAGISFNPTTISAADANAGDVEVTVTYDDAQADKSVYAPITVASTGAVTRKIDVIVSIEENYTPVAGGTNLTPDPTCSDASKFAGWGTKGVVSIKDEEGVAKSGAFCGKVTENGSFETNLTEVLEGNTDYVMMAFVKTDGEFNFSLTGGSSGTGSDLGMKTPNTNSEWELIEFAFTTGANPDSKVIFFNNHNCDGKYGYIDNWEVYKASDLVSINELEATKDLEVLNANGGVNLQAAKTMAVKVYTVTGQVVKQLNIGEGETFVSLPAGVYIINGTKAVVFN